MCWIPVGHKDYTSPVGAGEEAQDRKASQSGWNLVCFLWISKGWVRGRVCGSTRRQTWKAKSMGHMWGRSHPTRVENMENMAGTEAQHMNRVGNLGWNQNVESRMLQVKVEAGSRALWEFWGDLCRDEGYIMYGLQAGSDCLGWRGTSLGGY